MVVIFAYIYFILVVVYVNQFIKSFFQVQPFIYFWLFLNRGQLKRGVLDRVSSALLLRVLPARGRRLPGPAGRRRLHFGRVGGDGRWSEGWRYFADLVSQVQMLVCLLLEERDFVFEC